VSALARVGLELGDHREDVEQRSADRVGGIVHRAAEVELDLATGQFFGYRSCVGQRASEAVEFGDDELMALTTATASTWSATFEPGLRCR
jgi:hypothetical protein